MIPTPEQFLAKLAASPADAAAFDAATRLERPHCKSRREAVVATLNAISATIAENTALKAKVAATRAKVAALEVARKSQPASFMKTTPSPAKAPPAATATAASFATPQLSMLRSEFEKLSASDKSRYMRDGGKLI